MSWVNYHTHCNFCDGEGNPEKYAEEAIKNHGYALGFSSHAPFLYETKWAMKHDKLGEYIGTINQFKKTYGNKIDINLGLEIDYIPGVIGPSDFKDNTDLDYIIGAIHFISQYPDGKYWGIDGAKEEFAKGLEIIFNNDIKKTVKAYYDLVQQMILKDKPDIIGHIDIIKKNNKGNYFFSEEEEWYRNNVLETLQYVKDSGCIVEINTRGVTTKRTDTLYPSVWILEEMYKMDIPVTISSDAHKPEEVYAYFNQTAIILKSIGFKSIYALKNRKWMPFKFSENGLLT